VLSTNREKSFFIYVLILVAFILPFALTRSSVALAQTPVAYEEVGIIETDDLDLLNPTGLAFSPADNTFFVLPAHPAPLQPQGTTTIVSITPFADLIGTISVPAAGVDLLNMAFDRQANRLLLFDAATNDLVEIKVGSAGLLDPTAVTRIEAQLFGLQHPHGLAFDAEGRLFILDQAGPRLVRIEPDPTPGLDSATALEQGQVSEVDLKPLGLVDAQGLAFNPANSHLYLFSPVVQTLYELTETGQLVTSHDLALLNLSNPQGLVFASSRDTTDDPALINLFIADSGLNPTFTLTHQIYLPIIIKSSSTAPATIPNAAAGESQAGARPGQIVELSLTEPSLMAPLAATVHATLVHTTQTSQFSPPSPDPSGLAYNSASNTLIISDAEVDEMPQYFTGKNVFRATTSGSLVGKLTTTSFSKEPAGAAYNPLNQHLFFSDDAKKKVFEVNPGADGQYNTSDDIVTSFSTSAFGDMDPEGLAFDSWQGHLFMVDGTNEEVYRLTRGANGRFDGVSPAGDDQATHFDVTHLGLKDPEGMEFNPDNGHLYILSGKKKLIAETTTNGTLIRLISISSITSKASAGLAYAPASGNPTKRNLYVVDRAVDNGTNPNENDGKMYEFSFPPLP
jgi:uncharacterized protein YjiK